MHPIGQSEKLKQWFNARPVRPNAVLLVLFALMAAATTQIQLVPCKCDFHPVTDLSVFYRNYTLMLTGLFAFHFVASAHVVERWKQVLLVVVLSVLGLMSINLALDSATTAPSKFQSPVGGIVIF